MEVVVGIVITFVLIGIPCCMISSKAGKSGAWGLLSVIPAVGPIIYSFVMAYSEWPAVEESGDE